MKTLVKVGMKTSEMVSHLPTREAGVRSPQLFKNAMNKCNIKKNKLNYCPATKVRNSLILSFDSMEASTLSPFENSI